MADATTPRTIRCVTDRTLEIEIPLELLDGATPGSTVTFQVIVRRRQGEQVVEVERHRITVQVPGPDFDASHWRA